MFDYLGILISIILGLALTHLLFGCSRLIQLRHGVKIYWVQLGWTLNVLIYVLALWWGMFWWKHLTVWTFQVFLFLAAYSIVVFMMASLLFPVDFAEGADLEINFHQNRRWFFGLLLLALLLDIPETVAKGASALRDVPREYVAFLGVMIPITLVALITSNRRAHVGLCLAAMVTLIGYLTLTSLDRIEIR